MSETPITRAAKATPPNVARKIKGLSDRAIAWIFVAPTIFLLLAINIFAIPVFVWLIRIPYRILAPLVVVICTLGTFSVSASIIDRNCR